MKLLRFLIGLLIFVIGWTTMPAHAATFRSANGADVPINGSSCIQTPFSLGPITSVFMHYELRNTTPADLRLTLSHDDGAATYDFILRDQVGAAAGNLIVDNNNLTFWNGQNINGSWCLQVADMNGSPVGFIDYWELAVQYSVPANLTPFRPFGWSSPIVISRSAGTHTDSVPLFSTDTLSIDWAVANIGEAAAVNTFRTELYVDDVLRNFWDASPPLNSGAYISALDYSIGSLPIGSHTIKLKADSNGTIPEGDEADNIYTRSITISPPPAPLQLRPTSTNLPPLGAFTFDVTGGLPPYHFTFLANASGASISAAGLYTAGVTLGTDVARISDLLGGEVIANVAVTTILTQPVGTNVNVGDTVQLSVSAIQSPELRYQWRCNGINIPFETGPSLSLPAISRAQGGSYTVVVFDNYGTVLSDTAVVTVNAPAFHGADNFAERIALPGSSGVVSGTSASATVETDEPKILGKPSGHSVWYSWTAPQTGIATFRTPGTAFDTLLAIYSGTALNSLTQVAVDDDSGGCLTSSLQFNAVAGTAYHILLAGYGAGSGAYNLDWALEVTDQSLPIIVSFPHDQTVLQGADALFVVSATGPSLSYQWYFNGLLLPDGLSHSLTVGNVTPEKVGTYKVRITAGNGRLVETAGAVLEIGDISTVRSSDKVEDLFAGEATAGSLLAGTENLLRRKALSAASSFYPVSAGTVGSQLFNTIGSTTQAGENNRCEIGGASRWFGFASRTNGVMLIDTIGSEIDTILAIYQGPDLLSMVPVGCDNNGAPDGIRSLFRLHAVANAKYQVAVDGLNGTQGQVKLNWKFGAAPVISTPVTNANIQPGGSLTLTAVAQNADASTTYRWQLNGVDIFGATAFALTLENITLAKAGTYSVAVSNFAGVVTQTVAIIRVPIPILLSATILQNNGNSQLLLSGPSAHGYVLEASADLLNWLPVMTNSSATDSPLQFTDPVSTNAVQRFYRALPWPW
jgi:hypothetical protein